MPIPESEVSTIQPRRMSDVIHDKLLELIVSGALAPREILDDEKIAQLYDVSRTPVKEALNELASRGFVRIMPQRDTIVAPINESLYTDSMWIIGEILGQASREATNKLTEADIEYLQRNLVRQQASGAKMDSATYESVRQAEDSFFDFFVNRSGNIIYLEVLNRIRPHVMRARNLPGTTNEPDAIKIRLAQHEVLEATLARNEVEVEEAMRRFCEAAMQYFLPRVRLAALHSNQEHR